MNVETTSAGLVLDIAGPFVVVTTTSVNVVGATVKSVGYKYSLEEMTTTVSRLVLRDGIANLTYRKVANELSCSDRMVVYYFPTKNDLVMAAVVSLSQEMQALLEKAFGDDRRLPDELVEIAWPVLTRKSGDQIFKVFLEVIGLSASGVEPFNHIAPAILEAWVTWLSPRVLARSEQACRQQALGVMAKIDGLLLIRHTLGAKASTDAFHSIRNL